VFFFPKVVLPINRIRQDFGLLGYRSREQR